MEQSIQIRCYILEYKIPEGGSKEQRMKKERKKKTPDYKARLGTISQRLVII